MIGSIGTQSGRLIFGNIVDSDLAMGLPEGRTGRNPLVKLREASLCWFKLLRNMSK